MPTYVYEIVLESGEGGDTFEVFQRMEEDALTRHPESGCPVRRVLQAPNIAGKWSERRAKSLTSDKNLAEKGFTKYVNAGDGRYEKALGEGPETLRP